MLALIINISYALILMGIVLTIYKAFKRKDYKKILFFFIIPFYVFYYILKLPDEELEENSRSIAKKDQAISLLSKKVLAILTIGVFWVFFFVSILKIVFTPPV